MGNRASLEELLAQTETVTVKGKPFEISMPGETEMAALRKAQVQVAKLMPPSKDAPMSDKAIEAATQLAVKCFEHCLGLSEGEALQVLAFSGGEKGELATRINAFLGLKDEKEADDPGPSSQFETE